MDDGSETTSLYTYRVSALDSVLVNSVTVRPMAPPPAVSLRRNGTLQSCERCRTTKIKCDHSTPRCGRCLAKNFECVYEAAPMTRRFRAARFDVRSGRVRATTRAQDAAEQQQQQQPLPLVPYVPSPPKDLLTHSWEHEGRKGLTAALGQIRDTACAASESPYSFWPHPVWPHRNYHTPGADRRVRRPRELPDRTHSGRGSDSAGHDGLFRHHSVSRHDDDPYHRPEEAGPRPADYRLCP